LKKIMLVCLVLALTAAAGYFLMGAGIIHAADLTLDDAPPGFTWIAGAFYVLVIILVYTGQHRSLAALSIINAIPIMVFIVMWAGRPDVLFSLPGLMTKIPQILLETGLIYLAVKSRPAKIT
jgi:hypothetical protein